MIGQCSGVGVLAALRRSRRREEGLMCGWRTLKYPLWTPSLTLRERKAFVA